MHYWPGNKLIADADLPTKINDLRKNILWLDGLKGNLDVEIDSIIEEIVDYPELLLDKDIYNNLVDYIHKIKNIDIQQKLVELLQLMYAYSSMFADHSRFMTREQFANDIRNGRLGIIDYNNGVSYELFPMMGNEA